MVWLSVTTSDPDVGLSSQLLFHCTPLNCLLLHLALYSLQVAACRCTVSYTSGFSCTTTHIVPLATELTVSQYALFLHTQMLHAASGSQWDSTQLHNSPNSQHFYPSEVILEASDRFFTNLVFSSFKNHPEGWEPCCFSKDHCVNMLLPPFTHMILLPPQGTDFHLLGLLK
jgi:hypothetical protein